MYPYGIIGNCAVTALVSTHGSIDWLCLPGPDGAPFFGHLLDPDGGAFSISALGPARAAQRYDGHTNILITTVESTDGAFTITDFCPRYGANGRTYRPRQLCRIVTPIRGTPTIIVACRPVAGWEKTPLRPHASAHAIHFESGLTEATLTSTVAPADIIAERPIPLTTSHVFSLAHASEPIGDLETVVREALRLTATHWLTWVQHCSIPTLFQHTTIRSALALKLSHVEDTGAILAAPTTSLPEELGGERTWDYRFCWLRDAAFVLSAFHNLGHVDEMLGWLRFLMQLAARDEVLHPVYRSNSSLPLPEEVHLTWRGYRNSRPVRSNNQAAEHTQNDVYGEMITALTPIFLDERFADLRTREHEDLLGYLAVRAGQTLGTPDAGPWEFRSISQVHAFPTLMSWAGLERIGRLRERGFLRHLDLDVVALRDRARRLLEGSVVEGSLRTGPTDPSFDAALLLAPLMNYPDRGLNERTTLAIRNALRFDRGDESSPFIMRYRRADDFGVPRAAFVICSFWLIEALARTGHRADAARLMERMTLCANELGLMAEHFDPTTNEQSGNFPQAYSHVGAINAAFAVSPPWHTVL
jgi:GH15 family glucan-1,4-alpha-glucosidase